ncbi:hypothetical protein WICMUC_004376 [Wickerhamomyces mucosus]|uniref:NUC153 domain-containing protein n=1 Tax=Wickerhamomyces mucosus TaxID=1378264 RepID=A0A9P8PHV0_9ASCO|nr:hypothetical protein WICMUC_004376 [Wickerhamomyces mucosus]
MAKGSKTDKSQRSAITNDERFSGVHNDPRFQLPKRRDFKVQLDDRFTKSDLDGLKRKAKIDKYGRKLKITDDKSTLERYYKIKGDDKTLKNQKKPEDKEDNDEQFEDDASDDELDVTKDDEVKNGATETFVGEIFESDQSAKSDDDGEEIPVSIADRARGEGLPEDHESSGDESSSDEESSGDDDYDDKDEDIIEETKPEVGDPAKRFAVVNLDWDHVRSVDLMATFQSFVPSGGHIDSVSIYPSEFGKERLQKEEIEGPPREVFKKKKGKKQHEDSDSDSELDTQDLFEEADGEEDYDSNSLRKYQLQRLRYYYAVIVCDSIKTAKSIYDNVDGTEYESTANFFDLRFIPDEMEFDDDESRDTCDKIPSNYKPESFVTDALQHSKVKLTWDETPAERAKLSSKAFSQRELDDMDFKAYLASDNSDDEEDHQEDLKSKYRNLLGSSTKIGDRDIFDKGNDNDDVDMEITFTPGLDENAVSSEAPINPDEESTIDKLKRKSKERRKARKDKIKELKEQELEQRKTSKDETKKSQTSKKIQKEQTDKSQAELELLMLDENVENKKSQHFNLKEIVRSEKEKSKKNKHRRKEKIVEDDFKADLNDPRFAEIFTNHDFAIDPSQPQFKKTSTMNQILDERKKRREERDSYSSEANNKKRKFGAASQANGVHSLVEKLKQKSRK